MEGEKCHRFVMLANESTDEVYVMFTDTSPDSHNLFQYHGKVRPGAEVYFLNLKVERLLRSTNTRLFSIIEPLVPVVGETLSLSLPHFLEQAVFRYFEIVSTSTSIISAKATENVCPGVL